MRPTRLGEKDTESAGKGIGWIGWAGGESAVVGEGEEVGVVGVEERKEKKERRGFGVGGWGAGCAYVWVRGEGGRSVEGSFGMPVVVRPPHCEELGLLPTQPGTYTTPSLAPTMRMRSSNRARGCATSNRSRNASSRSMWRDVSSR